MDLNDIGSPGTYEALDNEDGGSQVAFYYDEEGNPARKEDATRVQIMIFDRNGNRIDEIYGTLTYDGPSK